MSLLDPARRSGAGERLRARLTGGDAPAPATPYEASWRDYVYAEVWARPGLDLRSRFLIALASAACAGDAATTEIYACGALDAGGLSVTELREGALHLAVYGGWSQGGILDRAVTAASGGVPAPFPPIRAEPWDAQTRLDEGAASFAHNMLFGGPPPTTAYFEGGILNFVFGEMWNRPGLDQRSRRWITLVGVGFSSAATPIGSHVWSAMASGNASTDEMYEFVLQYALHAGWPRGSVMQAAVMQQAPRVARNLPFEP